jgi:hypothetical protein
MAQTYTVKNGPPTGFDKKFHTRIQFQYEVVNNQLVFDYRAVSTIPEESRSLIELLDEKPFTRFFEGNRQVASLDIHIKKGDTLVEVETVPHDDGTYREFYWSPSEDAIQTEISRKDFYGELEYSSDGINWDEREEYENPQVLCHLIKFKARLNPLYADRNQKFSFFVYLKGPDNALIEHVIDPDIKNPSA